VGVNAALVELRAFSVGLRYPVARVPYPPPPPDKALLAPADRDPTALRARHWLLLLAITTLAAVVRTIGLGDYGMWVDEAHTWRDATMPLHGPEGFLATDRVLYSLSFFLLRGLLALGWIGETAADLRLPFVIAGVLTVPLVALCGRRLVGASAAVFAALLLAVHPWHVFWSQNARGYVFVVLAAVVVADRALAYAQRERLRDLLGTWLAIAIGTVSHATGGLLAVGFVAFLVLRRVRLGRRGLVWGLVGIVLVGFVLPWAVENWSPFQAFLRSKDRASLLHFVQTTGFWFRPLLLVLAVVGLWLLRSVGGRERAVLLGSLSLLPLAVLFALGAKVVLTTARYAICALPIVVWLAAFAAMQFGEAIGRAMRARSWARTLRVGVVPALLVIELCVQLVDYHGPQHGQRARWPEAAAFLQQQAGGRPIHVGTTNHPSMLWYLRPGQWRFVVPPEYQSNQIVPLMDWTVGQGVDHFKQSAHEPGAKNHVAWHRQQAKADGALLAFVVTGPELEEQEQRLADETKYPGVDGAIRAAIEAECRLALHLPCWVGPKDESISIYVLREP